MIAETLQCVEQGVKETEEFRNLHLQRKKICPFCMLDPQCTGNAMYCFKPNIFRSCNISKDFEKGFDLLKMLFSVKKSNWKFIALHFFSLL